MKKRLLVWLLIISLIALNGSLTYAEEGLELYSQLQQIEKYGTEESHDQSLFIDEEELYDQVSVAEDIAAPMVTDVKVVGVEDRECLSAPVTFQVQLTVKAPKGQKVSYVCVEYQGVSFGQAGYGETNKSEKYFRFNESWEPGIEGDICLVDISFGDYGPINEYRLTGIYMTAGYDSSIGNGCNITYGGNGLIEEIQSLEGSYVYEKDFQIDEYGDLPDLPTSQANIRITSSKKTDTVKPQITSIKPKEKVTSTHTYQGIEVGYKDMDSGIKSIWLIYYPEKNGNVVYQLGQLPSNRNYIGEGKVILAEWLDTGEDNYYLHSIEVVDNAGNRTEYERDNDAQLVAKEYNPDTGEMDKIVYTLDTAGTGFTTKDNNNFIDDPELYYIFGIDSEILAPGVMKCRIGLSDKSNLDSVKACCVLENGENVLLESDKVVKEGKEYICSFPLDKYSEEGKYVVSDLFLIDNSEGGKISNYWRDNDQHSFYKAGMKGSGMMDFVVTRSDKDMVILNINNITPIFDEINTGGTIVIKTTNYNEQIFLPQKIIETAVQKSLKIVILGVKRNSEIIVQGKDLKNNDEIELKIQRDALVQDTVIVGAEEDDLYYPVQVTVSDLSIPIILRIKVDNEFKKMCRGNQIRISKTDVDGSQMLIQDNLKVDGEGYVEVIFDKGLNNRRSMSDKEIQFIISTKKNEGIEVGDITQDGDISMADLMMCLHHVSGRTLLSGAQFTAADIDGDGKIAMADLMKLLHYVSGRNKEL